MSMELDSTEMIKRFVMAGLGASFVAATHCREEVAAGQAGGDLPGARAHRAPGCINL